MAIGAGVWAATGEPLAVPAAVVTGVLVDADHVLDYYRFHVRRGHRRHYVLLHGWEYSAAGLALLAAGWYNPVFLAAVLGHLGHLTGDHVANRASHPLAYSIIFRWYARFERDRFFSQPPLALSEVFHRSIPLWGRIEPWVLKVAPRFREM